MTDSSRAGKHLSIAACGFLMGGADIIPGVSGGTMALILGIYERLVTAISRFDKRLLALLNRREWSPAAAYVDLPFLLAVGCGIAIGIMSLANLMHYLLEEYQSFTFSAFFGLIVGSSLLVGRIVQAHNAQERWICFVLGVLGAIVALWIVSRHATDPHDGHGYTFACGAIAICAMILPGISGAYILLLLGKYSDITHVIKQLPSLQVSAEDLTMLAVFAAGCVMGLVIFSKLLHWLLAHWHPQTMAILCGFMIGSLYKIWPFQEVQNPAAAESGRPILQPVLPAEINQEVILCAVIAALALVAVLLLERFAGRRTENAGQ